MRIELIFPDKMSDDFNIDSDKTVRDLRREIGKRKGPLFYDSHLIASGVALNDDDQILGEVGHYPQVRVVPRDALHERVLQREGSIYNTHGGFVSYDIRQYPIIISDVASLKGKELGEIKQLAQGRLPESVLNGTTYVDVRLIETKEGHFSLLYSFVRSYERGSVGRLVQEFPFPVAQISGEIRETGKCYYLVLGMDGSLSKLSLLYDEYRFKIPDSFDDPIDIIPYSLPFRISRIGVITPYFVVLYDTRMNLVLMMRNRMTRDPEFRFLSLEKELPIPQNDLNNYEKILSSEEGDFYVISDRGPVKEVSGKFVLDSYSALYYEGEFVAGRLKDFEIIKHYYYHNDEHVIMFTIDEEDNLWKGKSKRIQEEKKWTVESFEKIGTGYYFHIPPKVESDFSFVKSARK